MMKKEICNNCGEEVIEDRKLDNNVWNCPSCGLEEYQSRYVSKEEANRFDLKNSIKQEEGRSKYYLNEEQTIFLTLLDDAAIIEGNGKIDSNLWIYSTARLSLKGYIIEIKENIQLPDDCSGMFMFFEKEINIDQSIDTSNIINMGSMFYRATSADTDVSKWDVSNVIDMSCMFQKAISANPDVSKWDVSKVKTMAHMFRGATSANPDTSSWDTSNVTNMSFMFDSAILANPDTSNWNVSNVEMMQYMFNGATSANPDVSRWDVSNVTNMWHMFNGAISASPDTTGWDMSNVKNMLHKVPDATSNQDISNWDISNVKDMSSIFKIAKRSNQDESN